MARNDVPKHWTSPGRQDSITGATLRRFAFRLVVVVGFAALWPSRSITSSATATAALCLAMGAACLLWAIRFREQWHGSGLNHLHEAAALLSVALLVYLLF